jgi:hypothetical protein
MSDIHMRGFRKFWPLMVVPIGLGLSITWVSLLGYGAIRLVQLAIRIGG